jgi:hypothetical protein
MLSVQVLNVEGFKPFVAKKGDFHETRKYIAVLKSIAILATKGNE